jgi:hypothetical protein
MQLTAVPETAKPATYSEPRKGEAVPSHVQTVVTAAKGKVCAEKISGIAFSGKVIGWVVEFLVSNIQSTLIYEKSKVSAKNRKISSFIKEIDEMKEMDFDWNGYGSESPNTFARETAITLLLSAGRTIVPNRVSASAQGGVGICFYRDSRYGDIECLNTGEILATISDGSGRPEVWEVGPNEAGRALERIGKYINPA